LDLDLTLYFVEELVKIFIEGQKKIRELRMRVCNICEVEKEITEYNLTKEGKYKYKCCKSCFSEKRNSKRRELYSLNKEEISKNRKELYYSNRDFYINCSKKYYNENNKSAMNWSDFISELMSNPDTKEIIKLIKIFDGVCDGFSHDDYHPKNSKKIKLNPHDLISGKRIYGSWGGDCKLDIDIKKIFEYFNKKNIFTSSGSVSFYSLENINQAFNKVISGQINRAIIKF
jgi:hypothetical protein